MVGHSGRTCTRKRKRTREQTCTRLHIDTVFGPYRFVTSKSIQDSIPRTLAMSNRPPRQATGPPRLGAGVGVGLLRGIQKFDQKTILVS